MNVLRTNATSLAREERGMIAAWFAILCMLVFFGFSFFVINLSNTHEHRRHLQVQADDAALAGGTSFTGCFQNPALTNKTIAAEALRFSGDPYFAVAQPGQGTSDYAKLFPSSPTPPGPFNQQVESSTRVRVHLNSTNYATLPSDTFDPTNGPALGTDFSLGLPCDTKFLDVKASDINVPTPFGGLVPTASSQVTVKARARVEIKKVVALNGMLPWAVPEVAPKCVAVLFVDDNGSNPVTPITTQTLKVNGAGCGVPLPVSPATTTRNGEAVSLWQGDALTNVGSGTGTIVVTSLSDTPDLTGSVPTICARAGIKCYRGSTATSGLDFIEGYPQTNVVGTHTVTLYDTTLQNLTCPDDSSPYYNLMANVDSCTVQLVARIDFGDLTNFPVKVVTCGNGCTLIKDSSAPCGAGSGGCWRSNAITINAASGRNQFDIQWCVNVGNGNGCNNGDVNGQFTDVQHAYAADTPSGPVDYMTLTAGGTFANALQTGAQTVHVAVGLQPPLHVTTSGEPPILLRLADKSGSLNQALDCDHAPLTLEDEVAKGCQTYYQKNLRNGVCDPPWNNAALPPATFVPPSGNLNDAPDCVAAKTGDVTAMGKGLHERWEDPAPPLQPCPPNNWPTAPNQPVPDSNDPRWVVLVVTNFAAFSGNGAEVVPVTKFAGFYVTGWFQGQGGSLPDGCATNQPPPNGALPTSKSVKGDVWGYFVTEVPNLPGATTSDEFCDFSEVGLCLPVLTQ